mgnify:FL=1
MIRIQPWPNNRGAEVTSGPLRLEIWEFGAVRRLIPDDSLTGSRGTHYTTVPIGSFAEMAEAAVRSWRDSRIEWQECQDVH